MGGVNTALVESRVADEPEKYLQSIPRVRSTRSLLRSSFRRKARKLEPAHFHQNTSMYASSSSKPKRQLVKAACTSCQKRKVKCSGERPTCALCQSRARICTYDSEAGLTRVEALRRRNKELAEQNAEYELVYTQLQNTPEAEAFNHLRNLREYADVETFAKTLKRDSTTSKRRRTIDGTKRDEDAETTCHLSPVSSHSQDGTDGETQSFAGPSPTTAERMAASQSPSMMIDPHLGFTDSTAQNYQQSMGLPYMPESTLEPTVTWPFQDAMFDDDAFQMKNLAWANVQQSHGMPDGHYNDQMFDPIWTDGELLASSNPPPGTENQTGRQHHIQR